jgi:hypothetical protein
MERPQINVFLSYTRRETEVTILQPAMDAYCEILLNWGRKRGVDIFFDRASIPQDKAYAVEELQALLRHNIVRSHVLVSFLSPEYIASSWCRFEYETKAHLAPSAIHKIYWKPTITLPFSVTLARIARPESTRFLLDVLDWKRIRYGDRGHWKDSRFNKWVFVEDQATPYNFSDLTEVYKGGIWAGRRILARCAQKTAEILCRKYSDMLGDFAEHEWLECTNNSNPR